MAEQKENFAVTSAILAKFVELETADLAHKLDIPFEGVEWMQQIIFDAVGSGENAEADECVEVPSLKAVEKQYTKRVLGKILNNRKKYYQTHYVKSRKENNTDIKY